MPLTCRADLTPTEHALAAPWSELFEASGVCRWLHVNGQVPPIVDRRAPIESRAAYGDLEAQTLSVLVRLRDKLEAAGFAPDDVVRVTGYLVREERLGGRPYLDGFSLTLRDVFEDDRLPVRTRILVHGLMKPARLVEIEAVAAKAGGGCMLDHDRPLHSLRRAPR